MNLLGSISEFVSAIDRHPGRCRWILTVFAVVWFLAVSLQGLDFADEGFSLTFYQNIFTHPDDVEYQFLYYLPGLLGGIWNVFFGWMGTYGFRVLFALTSGAIVFTAFGILSRYFRCSTVVLGILASIVWPGLCLYFFNRDCLTVLLFLLTVCAMIRGLSGRRLGWWCMGVLLVMNMAARLPNAVLTILAIAPIINAAYTRKYKAAVADILRIACGALVACVILAGTAYMLGHVDACMAAVNSLFVMGSDPSDSHGLGNLVANYIHPYKSVFTCSLYSVGYFVIFAALTRLFRKKWVVALVGAACALLIYRMLACEIYAMWGLVTASSIVYTIIHRRDSVRMILGLSSLSMLVLIPLGGDSYANVCNSCMWLGFPMTVDIFRSLLNVSVSWTGGNLILDNRIFRQYVVVCGVAFGGYVVTHSVCYFDDGSRWAKTYCPDVERATTFTSRERAMLVEDVVAAIRQYRTDGNYLLVFDNAPMLHYLTGMQPYLGSSWSGFWGNELFRRQLLKAEDSGKCLPMIAVPRFYYRDLSESDCTDVDDHPELKDKADILADFMLRHGYREVYRDKYIILYNI